MIRKPTPRYTYGHGFSMLFLSQVLGEEGLLDRREELVEVLTKAVKFSGNAQTAAGGWGYVSAREGNDFDEGSTTITQVQGLRGCRNAGIPVSGKVIERAKEYIYGCKNTDGGISYSSRQKGSSRPAITAAALAALYNAGDYDSKHVPEMLQVLQGHAARHQRRHPRVRPLALHVLVLQPSRLSARRRIVEAVSRSTVRSHRQPTTPRRFLGRPDSPGLRHGLQPDHVATGPRLLADLSAVTPWSDLSQIAKRRRNEAHILVAEFGRLPKRTFLVAEVGRLPKRTSFYNEIGRSRDWRSLSLRNSSEFRYEISAIAVGAPLPGDIVGKHQILVADEQRLIGDHRMSPNRSLAARELRLPGDRQFALVV